MLLAGATLNLYPNMVKGLVPMALILVAFVPLGYAIREVRRAKLKVPAGLLTFIDIAFHRPYDRRLLTLGIWHVLLLSSWTILTVRYVIRLAFGI